MWERQCSYSVLRPMPAAVTAAGRGGTMGAHGGITAPRTVIMVGIDIIAAPSLDGALSTITMTVAW